MRRMSNARAQAVGAPSDFPVIFESASLETSAGVSASTPLATALDADVVGFSSNVTKLVIRGITYTVRDLQPDECGMTQIVLEAT
jgi:hypothetical protein